MDGLDLDNKMDSYKMEKQARSILINEKLAKAEEVALMTCVEVCNKLVEFYEVVSCDDDKGEIAIVNKKDMNAYNDIVRVLTKF